jgi:hypothetical protein
VMKSTQCLGGEALKLMLFNFDCVLCK